MGSEKTRAEAVGGSRESFKGAERIVLVAGQVL